MVNMNRLRILQETIIVFFLVNFVIGEECIPTDLTDLKKKCSDKGKEICSDITFTCVCLPGYERINGICINKQFIEPQTNSTPNSSSLVDTQGSSHVVAGILTACFLIIIVISGVYYGRKYKLVKWVRNRIHQRNRNYDEFMIGHDPEDDDPPLP